MQLHLMTKPSSLSLSGISVCFSSNAVTSPHVIDAAFNQEKGALLVPKMHCFTAFSPKPFFPSQTLHVSLHAFLAAF